MPSTNKPVPIKRYATYQVERLLKIYSEQGKSLEYISVLVGRKSVTLKNYARRLDLSFTDYTPRRK